MVSLPSCPPRSCVYREPSSPQHTPTAAPPGQPQSSNVARYTGKRDAETLGYTDQQSHRRPSMLINPTPCLFLQVWADCRATWRYVMLRELSIARGSRAAPLLRFTKLGVVLLKWLQTGSRPETMTLLVLPQIFIKACWTQFCSEKKLTCDHLQSWHTTQIYFPRLIMAVQELPGAL